MSIDRKSLTSLDRPLRLGTRKSPLALVQAEEARRLICAAHDWALDRVELVPVTASGDKIQDRALAEIGGKALWTSELDEWLSEGRIDAAVHSMKDVETIRPGHLTIAAILPRADIRDHLIGAESIAAIPRGATIGTAAPRRAAQMLHHRPDCSIVLIRGNVATRLAKVEAGAVDASFLAAAGLVRLGQADVGVPLAVDEWLPATAQGAIGIECRADDDAVQEVLSAINHGESFDRVMAERAVLFALGGTCHSPVGMVSEIAGEVRDTFTLRLALFSADGRERVEGEFSGASNDIDGLHIFAKDLLQGACAPIKQLFENGA